MKKHLFIASVLLLILTGFFSSCKDKEKEEEPENPFRENIIGQWKLTHISISVNYVQPNIITDYSEENIIFDFQDNNKLVVHGSIPNDLGLFDDFQEGEHFYKYHQPSPSSCISGQNLMIYKPEGEYITDCLYFCRPQKIVMEQLGLSSYKTIGGVIQDSGGVAGGDFYQWIFAFIKLN